MSNEACSILLVACLDVCAGFCIDWTSLRHACTENLCRCSCCCRSDADDDYEPDEREPLINDRQPPRTEMPAQPPMQAKGR
ncbi:hypothetical protein GGX14DRAFT_411759 [Mycena pura]|uniref:Secreted protein n=1 Tax=Mycena pura TaxID=153505 RepID=A0AAD7E657_9AGAR|nr:hypothetical protein GGX14DRAFT_411759 [Mycena pura]